MGSNSEAESPQSVITGLCDQCLTLCLQFLSPAERIKCCILSPLFLLFVQSAENKSIWNDMRLSLQYSTNSNAKPFSLKLIHSQSSYPKPYNNCIAIQIDKEFTDSDNKFIMTHHWIFECISNIETYGANETIFNSQIVQKISFENTKYFTFDCIENQWCEFPEILIKFPNLSYLSFLNLGHNFSAKCNYSLIAI